MRKYGLRLDSNPEKLFKPLESLSLPSTTVPPSYDFSESMAPCYDQGQTNSCTANAACGAVQFIENDPNTPARMFVYYNERVIQNTTNQDDGATMGCSIQSLKTYGVCDETYWPFDQQDLFQKPTDQAYAVAKKDLLIDAYSVSTPEQIKSCISQRIPIIFGMNVYSFMESANMAHNGYLQMPSATDTYLGGHALLICGYDDSTKYYKIRNSWGTSWGLNGYFYAPYDYINNPNLTNGFYAVVKMG
jgi:C1A family cysteine protease